MKNIKISLLGVAMLLAAQACNTQKSVQNTTISQTKKNYTEEHGLNLEYMDKTVRPQDDFFSFVNGNWYKNTTIPSDKASWGSFNQLREMTDDASLEILNKILTENYKNGSEGQKIQAMYATYTDWNTRNKLGLSPINGTLAKIDAISNLQDLQNYLNEATLKDRNPLYDWSVYTDLKNSKINAVYLGSPSLGLGRDYYQKKSEANTKTLIEYTKFIAKLYKELGYKNADQTAEKLVEFEKQLANSLLTNEEGRDANKRYNPKTITELATISKNINLPKYLTTVGVKTDKVIISEIKYMQNLDTFINENNLNMVKDYLKVHLLRKNLGTLDKKMDDLSFEFYSKYMQGQQEQRPMNKRALSLINGVLGEAFGKLYVEKYFPAEAKSQMEEYVKYIRKAFSKRIAELDWMSATTKEKAQEKLAKFTVKIAYPDKWKNYNNLKLISAKDGGTYFQNIENLTEWEYKKNLKKIGKPVDKSEWGMNPQTVNAYYSPTNNEIVFPAAILQPPFFNFKADPAINFGGIGAVIGHEISHGFDDGGSRFDGDGNLKNWWTDADRKHFDEKVNQLAAQFDKFEPIKGTFVNGQFTSGENIGDLGGVSAAYEALQMYLKDHGTPGLISGYTQEQRFFMSWATVWRTKSTDAYIKNQVKTDPHTPGYYRAFAPLLNLDGFHKAFETKPGDKMYKAPQDRVKMW